MKMSDTEHYPATPSFLNSVSAKWNTFWFTEVPAHPLAAFRILFGIYLLGYFLSFAPKVNLMFSNRGVYVPYLIPDLALTPIAASTLYIVTLIVIGSFVLGAWTRIVTPLLFALYLYFYFLNLAVKNAAYDRLNLIFLCILCFTNLDCVWSIRRQPAKDTDRQSLRPTWASRMICSQAPLPSL